MKSNKNIYYFIFLIIIVLGILIYVRVDRENQKKHPQIAELALEPDILINTADRYLHDHKRLTAVEFLEDAIKMMEILKVESDNVELEAIEVAIHDLKVVEKHIKADDINDDIMYEAFADAMNSLAYASLRAAENFIVLGKKEQAEITLKHSIEHIHNSIKYARGDQKEEEIKIMQELTDIVEHHTRNDIYRIEHVMTEIDSVVRAHIIK